MLVQRNAKKGKSKGKKQLLKFTIDCTVLVNDELLETASFQKFLADRIKVNGKAGNLGDAGECAACVAGGFRVVHVGWHFVDVGRVRTCAR